jgi:hypothetical protein
MMTNKNTKRKKAAWRQIDLHVHTPASSDFLEPEISYLDILEVAESKDLDIIAFTDHNTVAGYREMMEEIEKLEMLERLGRIQPKEAHQLKEYQRLLDKVLVLPGFEFTATLGFHILGIFPLEMDVRELEFILRKLNIPPEKIDDGSTQVGATSDVLTAYRVIDAAGGIVIAAHANANHGVAMRKMGFGGQTRIAYTQDPHLHALEVTDMEKKGRHTTMRFFNGSRPEYPRPMRCIQGSDCHRLVHDPDDHHHLGLGERTTEILLPEVSFEALRKVLLGNDFALTRPYRPAKEPMDYVQAAREEGSTIVQDFHARYTRRGGNLYAILADISAFANTNGGAIYVGVSADPNESPLGVSNTSRVIKKLQAEIERRITPPIDAKLDVKKTQNKQIIRIAVPRGGDAPYAIDENRIYIRSENETNMAVRDEIVNLVKQASGLGSKLKEEEESGSKVEPPRTGVEIVESVERKGTLYHTMRDLRNDNEIKNVTRQSARRLWHYAITQAEDHPMDKSKIEWQGDIGLYKQRKYAGRKRYDLVQREDKENGLHIYYGVTEDGIHSEWAELVDIETNNDK